jgi:GDP/UDP-N,N'-diacetylbacillosamine 2-epimerase (hydrolysing)
LNNQNLYTKLYDHKCNFLGVFVTAELWDKIDTSVQQICDTHNTPKKNPEPMKDWEKLCCYWDFKYPINHEASCDNCKSTTDDWRKDEPRKFILKTANIGGLATFECLKCSAIITKKIKDFVVKNNNSIFIESLGRKYYLNVLKRSKIVIGNTSSGIVEAPSLGIPTINIGNRQKNRLSTSSIINCSYSSREIKETIKKVLSNAFQTFCKTVDNPYDPYKDGRNSERIVYVIKKALELPKEKLMTKKFDTKINKSKWNYLLENFS